MPTPYTGTQIRQALAEEAYRGEYPICVDSTTTGSTTTVIVGGVAYGASGATANKYHDIYIYVAEQVATDCGKNVSEGGTFSATDTTLTMEASHGLVAGDVIKIDSEYLKVWSVSTNDLTVERGWQGSTATTHANASDVYYHRPYIGEVSKVLSASGFAPASGTFTVAPAFTGGPVSGKALIFHYGERPEDHWSYIIRTLRNMRYPGYLPVTLCPDGDMEDTGVTTWAAEGSPTTREKATSPFPFGRQALHIVAGLGGTGALGGAIPVGVNETPYVAVPIKVISGSASVTLYDATNSTALKTVTVTAKHPVLVYFTTPLASTTKSLKIQLLGVTTTNEFYAGPVWVWTPERHRYPLDTSSVARATDVKGATILPLGETVETDVYMLHEPLEDVSYRMERDDRANQENIIIPWNSYPTFMQVESRYPELTFDTDTTYAERDMVVQGAMYYIEMARAARMAASNPPLASLHRSLARDYAGTYSTMLQAAGISLVEALQVPSNRAAVRFA